MLNHNIVEISLVPSGPVRQRGVLDPNTCSIEIVELESPVAFLRADYPFKVLYLETIK